MAKDTPIKRLYDRAEPVFVVFWIAAYCAIVLPIRAQMGDGSFGTPIALAVLYLGILKFVFENDGVPKKYGLTVRPKLGKRYGYGLPMLMLATGSLWGGVQTSERGWALVCALLTMVMIGFLEELIFRGFLFTMLRNSAGVLPAIIVSSIAFSAEPLANLLTGSVTASEIAQMAIAVAWGFLLTMTFYKSGSIWAGVILHALIGILSKFSVQTPTMLYAYAGAAIVVAAGYGYWLCRLPDAGAGRGGQ